MAEHRLHRHPCQTPRTQHCAHHQGTRRTAGPASLGGWTSTQDALCTLAMPGYIVIDLPHRHFSPRVKVYRKVIHLFTVTYSIIICYDVSYCIVTYSVVAMMLLICNKQYPHLAGCCMAQKPAFLGSHDERIWGLGFFFLVFGFLLKNKKKKKLRRELVFGLLIYTS